MKRWKLTPQADVPQGPSVHHASEIHEGDEDSLSARLSDLQAMTGTPYAAEEDAGEDARTDEERQAEVDRADSVKAKQDEAEAKGRPVAD